MKKNLSFLCPLFLGATLFFTTSCEEDDKNPAPSPIAESPKGISDPNYFLSNAEVTEIDFAGLLYKFQYGANQKIEKVEGSFSFEEDYEGQTVIVDLNTTHDLIYTENRFTSIDATTEINYSIIEDGEKKVLFSEEEAYSIAAQYDAKGLLSSLTETHDEDFVVSLNRTYNSEGKLIKESQSEDGQEFQYQTFQWDGQNVVNDKLFSQPDSENERRTRSRTILQKKQQLVMAQRSTTMANTLTEENTFAEFDSKVNPLNVLSLFGFTNGFFISENNPKSVRFSDNGEETTKIITHSYDSKGRINKYSMTDPVEGPVTINLKYKN